jgi:hypothetical protein
VALSDGFDALARMPSNRKFGLFFTLIFFLCGLAPKFVLTGSILYPFLFLSFIFLVISLTRPNLLSTFNLIWFRLGIVLGRVLNPITLGIIFYLMLSPIAIVARLLGRNELRLGNDDSDSYWITVPPSKDSFNAFKNQF